MRRSVEQAHQPDARQLHSSQCATSTGYAQHVSQNTGGKRVQVRPGFGVVLSACIGVAAAVAFLASVWVDLTVIAWGERQVEWVRVLSRVASLGLAAGVAFLCARLMVRTNPDPRIASMAGTLIALPGFVLLMPEDAAFSALISVMVFVFVLRTAMERLRSQAG